MKSSMALVHDENQNIIYMNIYIYIFLAVIGQGHPLFRGKNCQKSDTSVVARVF